MADITVTAANVHPHDGATIKVVTAATICTAGQLIYKDTTDSNKYRPVDAGVAASAVIAGIAMSNSSDGESMVIATGGEVDPGGTVAVGVWYTASSNAGGIAPTADNTATNYPSLFGYGLAADKILITITNTSTAKA